MDQSSLKSGQQNLTMGTLPNLVIRKKNSKDKKYDRFKGKRTFQKSKVSMGSLKLHPMLRTSAEIICEAALFLNDKENM
jgi:hypothetical protein